MFKSLLCCILLVISLMACTEATDTSTSVSLPHPARKIERISVTSNQFLISSTRTPDLEYWPPRCQDVPTYKQITKLLSSKVLSTPMIDPGVLNTIAMDWTVDIRSYLPAGGTKRSCKLSTTAVVDNKPVQIPWQFDILVSPDDEQWSIVLLNGDSVLHKLAGK